MWHKTGKIWLKIRKKSDPAGLVGFTFFNSCLTPRLPSQPSKAELLSHLHKAGDPATEHSGLVGVALVV